jgi:hypothetical protein
MPARDMRGGSRRFPIPAQPASSSMETKTMIAKVAGFEYFIGILLMQFY